MLCVTRGVMRGIARVSFLVARCERTAVGRKEAKTNVVSSSGVRNAAPRRLSILFQDTEVQGLSISVLRTPFLSIPWIFYADFVLVYSAGVEAASRGMRELRRELARLEVSGAKYESLGKASVFPRRRCPTLPKGDVAPADRSNTSATSGPTFCCRIVFMLLSEALNGHSLNDYMVVCGACHKGPTYATRGYPLSCVLNCCCGRCRIGTR